MQLYATYTDLPTSKAVRGTPGACGMYESFCYDLDNRVKNLIFFFEERVYVLNLCKRVSSSGNTRLQYFQSSTCPH